jgi:hypothetical protein
MPKKVVGRAWTAKDVRELKSLARKRTGVVKISKTLKRTVGATAVKAHQLGVSLDTRDEPISGNWFVRQVRGAAPSSSGQASSI